MRMRTLGRVTLLSVVTTACGGATQNTPDAGTTLTQVEPKFSSIQKNIFAVGCSLSSCHGGGNAGLLDLTTAKAYTQLLGADGKGAPIPVAAGPGETQGAADGYLLVTPSNPAKSFLLLKVSAHVDSKYGLPMPEVGDPLSAQEVQAISDWITAGALNN
jgi:hypothetical protein